MTIVIAGMLGLALAMGIGRFSFSTILPLMQRDLGLTYGMGGWLAGVNLVGYMMGALLCFVSPKLTRSPHMAASMFALSILTTWSMGLTENTILWTVLRSLAGFASGILFVYVTSEGTERLIAYGRSNWTGAIYGGVGLGIALTGIFTPVLDNLGQTGEGWSTAWIGFGILAIFITLLAFLFSHQTQSSSRFPRLNLPSPIPMHALHWLTASYFFEALAYIVSATFLVTIISNQPQTADLASWSWIIVGCAAIPATFCWTWLGRRIGTRPALILAYALQGSGMLLCIHAKTLFDVIYVALAFGGTFMGIVALTMSEGARRSPSNGSRFAAWLTVIYGIGQIIAPVIAGWLADITQSFALPLSLASGCVLISIILITCDKYFKIPTGEITVRPKGA